MRQKTWQKMYVRLCENSIFSFKSINQKLNQKFLRCFYARNLVWQRCSFAPVQKNQNPSGDFDFPGPERSTSAKSQIWDVFAQVSFPNLRFGLHRETALAVAKIAQILAEFTFSVLFRWFFGIPNRPLSSRIVNVNQIWDLGHFDMGAVAKSKIWTSTPISCGCRAKIGHVYKGNMCSDFTVFHTEKSTKPNCVQ